MKVIVWIKTFFRKLFTSNNAFEAMERESKFYKAMMSLIHIDQYTEYVDAKTGSGATMWRFPKSDTYTISVNIKDMLEAGGIGFDDSFKWNVKCE